MIPTTSAVYIAKIKLGFGYVLIGAWTILPTYENRVACARSYCTFLQGLTRASSSTFVLTPEMADAFVSFIEEMTLAAFNVNLGIAPTEFDAHMRLGGVA